VWESLLRLGENKFLYYPLRRELISICQYDTPIGYQALLRTVPGMETVVVGPSECEAVSVHGQGQCLLPYGAVASLLTRGRTSVDPTILHIRDW